MGAGPGREIEPPDLRIEQVLRRRLLRSLEELLAIDDLHHAALVGAVAEIDAVGLRAERDHAMQLGRHRAGRVRLLAGQAEIPDLCRMGRIGKIVDLRHAPGAPPGRARNQIGNAGVAFPPALMSVLESVDARE